MSEVVEEPKATRPPISLGVSKPVGIEVISARHRAICRLLYEGKTQVSIAKELKISESQVQTVKNDPLVQDHLATLEYRADKNAVKEKKTARKVIEAMQVRAAEVIAEIMDTAITDSVRLTAAKDLLDRGGHAAPKVINVSAIHGYLTREDIEDMKARAIHEANEAGMVDVEVEEVISGEV